MAEAMRVRGVVSELRRLEGQTHAGIRVASSSACPRCAEGRGCGAGIAGAGRQPVIVDIVVPGDRDLKVGDEVALCCNDVKLLASAALAYGLPLGAAVLATAAAWLAGLGETASAVAALAGLAGGLGLAAPCLRRRFPAPGWSLDPAVRGCAGVE